MAKGYVARLLGNPRIVRWLSRNRPEYIPEFESIAEIESIPAAVAGVERQTGTRTR